MNIEIANRLVQLRKQHGFSQEELAARLGLSRQAVSKWERAEASPDTDNLILLSRVYGVSIDQLLRTEDPIPEPEPEKGVKVTINGKPVRFHAKDGFYFSVGDEEDEAALLRGDKKGVGGHIELNFRDDDDEGEEEDAEYGGIRNDLEADEDADGKPFLQAFPYPVFTAILYLCLGFAFKLWHPGWIVFLTILIYYPIVNWVYGSRRHSFWKAFPYVMLITVAFFALGCIWGLWHPAWVLYLTIPLYYTAAQSADRRYRAKRRRNESETA